MIVTDGSARLSDVLNAALSCSLDVITEGEECVGTECYIVVLLKPLLLLFLCKYFGLNLEELLPSALGKNVVVLIGDIDIDSVKEAFSFLKDSIDSESISMVDSYSLHISSLSFFD